MAGIDFNTFLGGTSGTSSMNFGIDLGEYASIKNGSYYKVAKANYAKEKTEGKKQTTNDSKMSLSNMQSGGEALKAAADKLSDRSLWEMKTVKVKDEETGEMVEKLDYDRAAINSAIQSFVSAYNDMIESAGNADTKTILKSATRMIKDTESVSKLLDQIGIKIGDDNKLSVDEEKLKDASVATMKTLFEGYGSFADHISTKASSIARSAKEATDNYQSDGNYNKTAGVSGTGGTTNKKAAYQLTDEMQKAILEQVKLDFYMYGGSTFGKTDSAAYTKKLNKFLESVPADKKSDAKDSVKKFRDELSSLVVKAIKAEDGNFKVGNTVDNSVLTKVFAKEDDLLKKAAAQAYGNSFNYSV